MIYDAFKEMTQVLPDGKLNFIMSCSRRTHSEIENALNISNRLRQIVEQSNLVVVCFNDKYYVFKNPSTKVDKRLFINRPLTLIKESGSLADLDIRDVLIYLDRTSIYEEDCEESVLEV